MVHVHSEGGVLSEPEPGMSFSSAFEDNNIADLKTYWASQLTAKLLSALAGE